MNREEASNIWQIIKAYGEGKTIQEKHIGSGTNAWVDMHPMEELELSDSYWEYRIKPEGNYTIEQNIGENRIESGVLSVSGSVSNELNEHCKWCKGKGCNCATCHNKDEENSYYLLHKDKFPEPKEKHYRPFNNCDELVETYHNRAFIPIVAEDLNQKLKRMYRPEIWVIHKGSAEESLITAFDNTENGSCVYLQDVWLDMDELFEKYTFLDGSPVGKLE